MMNYGKEGASYRYSNSFVQLLCYIRVYFHLLYIHTGGVVITHADCFVIIINAKMDKKIIAATVTIIITTATRIGMDAVKNCWLDSIYSYNLKAACRSGVIVIFMKVATLSYGTFVSISEEEEGTMS